MKGDLAHLDDTKATHYKLQLNLYKYLIEKYSDHIVDEMHVACFHPDVLNEDRRSPGPYVIDVPVMQDETAFLMAHHRKVNAEAIVARFSAKLQSRGSKRQRGE
jgi:hypothetical protein